MADEDDDDIAQEVRYAMEFAFLAIILPLQRTDDLTLTCFICDFKQVEYMFKTRCVEKVKWHGIHEACARPYIARKNDPHQPDPSKLH